MYSKIFSLLFAIAAVLTFSACGKDDDHPTPSPQPQPSGEVEAYRAELVLAAGHFHGVAFHQDPEYQNTKYLKPVQRMTFELHDGKWKPVAGSVEIFRVMSSHEYLYPYGLWIHYYDAQGKEITAQIAANGVSRHHQHFFTPLEVKPTFDGQTEADDNIPDSLINYVYMDTKPTAGILKETVDPKTGATIPAAELVGSRVVGTNALGNIFEPLNPIGMKGFFQFKKPRKTFLLNVALYHFDGSGKFIGDKASGFNGPTAGQRAAGHLELSFKIPIVVYASREETGEWRTIKDSTPFDQLRPIEQRLVLSTAKAYATDKQTALSDWFKIITGEIDGESGALWF